METNQQNQDEIEIDLLELLRVLCSKIGYVILAALALGLLMVLVSKVLMNCLLYTSPSPRDRG